MNQSRLVLFGGQDARRKFADTWEAPMTEPGMLRPRLSNFHTTTVSPGRS